MEELSSKDDSFSSYSASPQESARFDGAASTFKQLERVLRENHGEALVHLGSRGMCYFYMKNGIL